MEELQKKIDNKLKFLTLSEKSLAIVVKNGNLEELENDYKKLNNEMTELKELTSSAIKLQIEMNKNMADIEEWSNKYDEKIDTYRSLQNSIKSRIEEIKSVEIESLKEEAFRKEVQEEENYQKLKERQLAELELQKVKLELQTKSQSPTRHNDKPKVRLPKLVITQFNGTPVDWQRFWNQFKVEIDETDIPQVSKFSYLKELIIPKVRQAVDGLPFSSEGYERAKNILQDKYGETSEIINAHIQAILQLPVIHGTNPKKIHDFYEKLSRNVQVLETMGRLQEVNGAVRMTLDKLPHVRSSLVLLDDNWKQWNFSNLVNALKQWTERNPLLDSSPNRSDDQEQRKKEKLLQTQQKTWAKGILCDYCKGNSHKAADCQKVKEVAERKKIIFTKRLCLNCLQEGHRVGECESKRTCFRCKGRHHTSICQNENQPAQPMLSTKEKEVVYPVVLVTINGIKCRALLDTGAGSSYISSTLAAHLQQAPVREDYKLIETMLKTTNVKVEIYELEIYNTEGNFFINTEVSKVNKPELVTLPNPRYESIIQQYQHLKGVKMEDNDNKDYLPVHVILGAADYTKIKTKQASRVGYPGEPVAEKTAFGWTLIAGGIESKQHHLLLTRSTEADYAQLCSLDVLGLQEESSSKDHEVYREFQDQLGRNKEGWYETNILWKENSPILPPNEAGSLARTKSLIKKLKNDPTLFNEYDDIIRKQIDEGIVERIPPGEPSGKLFYLPHRPVVRETAESTKVRIVFDASARENDQSPSLNDVIEVGPPLQNNMWNVLLRNRMCPIILTGDIKQAFLQVRIRKEDRDALRFHWLKSLESNELETLRFTRAIFGMGESPFLLNGTIREHLQTCKELYPDLAEVIEEIKESLYVDDIVTGGTTADQVITIKNTAKKIFKEAGFELHKWHSNVKEAEDQLEQNQTETTYAKQTLGTTPSESKILGVQWNKETDTFGVNLDIPETANTKRGMLKFLASVFDPLGLISPIMLLGKNMFREACDLKLTWDEELPTKLKKVWQKWICSLPSQFNVPRSLPAMKCEIKAVDLHVFADASLKGVSAAVYAVVYQKEGSSQGLLTSKSRLSKKDLSIPRLELVAVHVGANLMESSKAALTKFPIKNVYGWTDSMVVLYWLQDQKGYKQFVSNRIRKINEKHYIEWRHVSTKENPVDIGSRGCNGMS